MTSWSPFQFGEALRELEEEELLELDEPELEELDPPLDDELELDELDEDPDDELDEDDPDEELDDDEPDEEELEEPPLDEDDELLLLDPDELEDDEPALELEELALEPVGSVGELAQPTARPPPANNVIPDRMRKKLRRSLKASAVVSTAGGSDSCSRCPTFSCSFMIGLVDEL